MSRPKVWRCVKMIFLRALSIYREHLSVINPSMTVLNEEGGFSRALILAAFDILMRSRLPSSGVWTKVCLCDAPWIVDTKLKETVIKSFPPIKISEKFKSFWIFSPIRSTEYQIMYYCSLLLECLIKHDHYMNWTFFL